MRALIILLLSFSASMVSANETEIVGAEFSQLRQGLWSVDVTLLHDDTGWEHYADIWRVVDRDGAVLGERVLLHPHEDEQPFTRGTNVSIPDDLETVYIEAHDTVHGWASQRLEISISAAKDGYIRVMYGK